MIEEEDERFKAYLMSEGYDVSTLGIRAAKAATESRSGDIDH
jgi:hypothetical protein